MNLSPVTGEEVIYQKRHAVFHPRSRHQEVGWKMRCSRVFEDWLRGVWILDETLSEVFDMASTNEQKFSEKLARLKGLFLFSDQDVYKLK